MKKLLLAMTALTALGLSASASEVGGGLPSTPTIPNPVIIPNNGQFPPMIGGTVASEGNSYGVGSAFGKGSTSGFGTNGTTSAGIAGYSSLGAGGGTTNAQGALVSDPNQTAGSPGPGINLGTFAGSTSFAIGSGATLGAASSDTNGKGGFAADTASSSAAGFGNGFAGSQANGGFGGVDP